MLHAGLDLSRNRLDVCLLTEHGELIGHIAAPPDGDGLRGLARRVAPLGAPVRGVVESMNGARFVHDTLEEPGWEVLIADAQRVKGLAPLACKTDRIDARVLAELSWRELVPAIWLPDPTIRRERELARFRLHLVRHRTSLKNRIHATLITFGNPCPVSDLFGHAGRELLDRLAIPDPWRRTVDASLVLIDEIDLQVAQLTVELRRLGADHRYIPLLVSVPGVGWVIAFTIASEIGDINRFSSPTKLCGYTGLCPKVKQSGNSDRRGPIGVDPVSWTLERLGRKARAGRMSRCHEHVPPTRRSSGVRPSSWCARAAVRSRRSPTSSACRRSRCATGCVRAT
jgi:transposase